MKMRLPYRGATGLFLLASLALTGCLNLKPVADTTRYYVLEGVVPVPSEKGTAGLTAPLRLGLGPVQLPEYLRRNEMVVRQRSGQVKLMQQWRWAESLDQGVQRSMAVNLARLLQTRELELNSWSRDTVDWEVYVDVFRFEANDEGTVTLLARWRVGRPGMARAEHVQSFEQSIPAPPAASEPDEMVAAMNTILARLAEEVAAALRTSLPKGEEH